MKVTVAGLGKKHELDLGGDDTVRHVKARLEPLTGLAAAEMKLLIKGKAPDDAATLGALGVADGAKVMLMRSQLGAKSASVATTAQVVQKVVAGAPAWLVAGARVSYQNSHGFFEPAVVLAVHTDDPSSLYCTITMDGGTERQTSVDRLVRRDSEVPGSAGADVVAQNPEAGSGPISVVVAQGKRQLTLHCEATSTVAELKALLSGLVGADTATMKLLARGKEATDTSTVDSLGLAGGGGRMMLLFRARYHREEEGAAAVASCEVQLTGLRARIEKARHQITKRLLAGAEALALLGELDGEVAALAQDLHNAAPAEGAEAAELRTKRLSELDALAEELKQARQAEAQAELEVQRRA
jgi:hypothetical protein